MLAQFADRVPDERLCGWARVKKPNRVATPCQAPTTMRWSYRVPLAFWFLGLVRLGPPPLQDHTGGRCVGASLQVGCRQFDGHLICAFCVWLRLCQFGISAEAIRPPPPMLLASSRFFHAIRQTVGCITPVTSIKKLKHIPTACSARNG